VAVAGHGICRLCQPGAGAMGLAVAKPQAIKNMLTRIVCPNCGHVGATAAMLPRVLICSQCGHAGLIRSGRQARPSTVTREEQAAEHAAWTRYEAEAE
jgi:predicted RNA-binding Zn-ribbon protein involved in translation (DUF1610 family)